MSDAEGPIALMEFSFHHFFKVTKTMSSLPVDR